MSRLVAVFLLIAGLVAVSISNDPERSGRCCDNRWHRITPFGETGYCPVADGLVLSGKMASR